MAKCLAAIWAQVCSSECTNGLTWACCSGLVGSNTPRRPRESRAKRLAAPSSLRRARMGLQQSMRFVQMLDTARVLPTSMITGDSDILERSRHSEPYLTKSEVRLRSLKIARRLDKQGLRRVPASPECA